MGCTGLDSDVESLQQDAACRARESNAKDGMKSAIELDSTDKAIMAELQVDGRLAFSKLAPRVGLSEAATRQRVNKLLEQGVMEIVAITDPTGLGLRHQSLLGLNVDTHVRDVAAELAKIENIDYVVITAGRYDIIAEAFTADADTFLEVVNDQVRPIAGIKNLEILTYLDLVKQTYNWGTA
jgi:Lrp/AsnC family transcriptional regulator for asnA, asnC and gidA